MNKLSTILVALCVACVAAADKFAEGSESRELMKIAGHVSAAFTPVNASGGLDFTNLDKMAKRLHDWGIPSVMVGGTTGESLSFTLAERYEVLKQWVAIAPKYNLRIYAHVGMEVTGDAKLLAKQSAELGVHGIFCMPPVYFKPQDIPNLIDIVAEVASGAPDLPIWYYHFPAKTGVDFNMFDFIQQADASGKIPNLMGVKFTNEILMDFTAIGNWKDKKYQMLMGRDEMMTSALATGVCQADVGSTVNFMAFNIPLRELFNELTPASMALAQKKQL